MTAKIIPFDGAARMVRPPEVRAGAIRAAIMVRPMMKRGSERLLVGESMWRILQRLEDELGLPKAKVLHEAGLGRPEESTKRLPYYAVRPGLDEGARAERAKHLTQKASKYVALAVAAARLAGLPADGLVAALRRDFVRGRRSRLPRPRPRAQGKARPHGPLGSWRGPLGRVLGCCRWDAWGLR